MICSSLILGLHLVSAHYPAYDYQNNFNPGIYAECDGWSASVYRNTLNRTSVSFGYTFRYGPVSLALGAVTGYQIKQVSCPYGYCTLGSSKYAIAPAISPSINLGPIRLWYVPRVRASSNVFHISLEREF